ncbi:serine hydrolase domain-containing protein [Naumannella halotolerans]|uniref:serine hydrolase domain-containing protein n=1 Tax=Naumannella halotolerans TaxID=993414 RepID=UPI00370D42AD
MTERFTDRRTLLISLGINLCVGLAIALLIAPTTHLGDRTDGDPELAERVRKTLGSGAGYGSVAAAEITTDSVSHAGLGPEGEVPNADSSFELGSITKTFTASLLALAIERDEVTLDDPVADHLPELAASEAGTVTLRELATHTSGIPSIPPAMATRWSFFGPGTFTAVGGNPYRGVATATLLQWVAQTPLDGRGEDRYSNAGVAVLGHALAAAAGTDYSTLLQDRLLDPLGMESTVLLGDDSAEPEKFSGSHMTNGIRAVPWSGEAFAPAGTSTRTTAADLSRYAQALLDGTAPGAAAMEPIAEVVSDGVPTPAAMLWQLEDVDGTSITWHNGGTAGSSSMLAIDREAGRAVLLLSNHYNDESGATTDAGILLVTDSEASTDSPPLTLTSFVPVLIGLFFGLSLPIAAFRRKSPTRLQVAGGVFWGLAGVLVILIGGPWANIPPALLAVPIALLLWASSHAVRRLLTDDTTKTGWWSIPSLLIGAAVLAYCLACVAR